jgi:hypothetical protein
MSAGTVQARLDSGAHADVIILSDAIGKLTKSRRCCPRAPIFSS